MQLFYLISCVVALFCCAILGYLSRPKQEHGSGDSKAFRDFQFKYLVAWAIAVSGDWLQGPYLYVLYETYGYSRQENAQLFVCGYGASFFFGTFVAGFADLIGRKRAILLYCFLYIVSCSIIHVNNYYMLMLGRILTGIGTSILHSAFESWLVCEHNNRYSFTANQLSYNFSMMYSVNYFVAVCSGFIGDSFVNAVAIKPVFGAVHFGGFLIPFFVAILCKVVCAIYICLNWEENYGTTEGIVDQLQNFGRGLRMVCSSGKMTRCCVIVALFESAMFIFIFNWTPVLRQGGQKPPCGMIFATFMMCCMMGASLFGLCSKFKPTTMLSGAICVAACAMLFPSCIGISKALTMYNFWAFMLFELTIGVYFPSICTLKSEAVPECHRSTIYNLFRMPMNAIVVVVLLMNPDLVLSFKIVFANLALAGCLMVVELTTPSEKLCHSEGVRLMKA